MDNIFNESESNYFHRFSVMIISLFVYYAITYYGLLKYHLQCLNLPHFTTLIIIIVFHLVQVVAVKKLHDDGKYFWTWTVILLPVFLYIIVLRYYDYMRKQQANKLNLMLYQMQQQNQPSLNHNIQFQPQQNTTPPNTQMMTVNTAQGAMISPPYSNHGLMMNQPMMNDMPAYGDYVSQFNSINQPMMNMTQPYGNTFNPYNEPFSPF